MWLTIIILYKSISRNFKNAGMVTNEEEVQRRGLKVRSNNIRFNLTNIFLVTLDFAPIVKVDQCDERNTIVLILSRSEVANSGLIGS